MLNTLLIVKIQYRCCLAVTHLTCISWVPDISVVKRDVSDRATRLLNNIAAHTKTICTASGVATPSTRTLCSGVALTWWEYRIRDIIQCTHISSFLSVNTNILKNHLNDELRRLSLRCTRSPLAILKWLDCCFIFHQLSHHCQDRVGQESTLLVHYWSHRHNDD